MNNVTKSAGERHNHDVQIILSELRETAFQKKSQVVDAVVDVAFRLEVDRGETSERHRADFAAWSRLIVATARSGDGGLDKVPWNESLKKILRAYLSITESADGATGNLDDRIRQVDTQAETTLSADELVIAQVVSGVLQGSVALWRDDPPAQVTAKKKDFDYGQTVNADVMGAITGAAGAAVSAPWTAGLSGAAVGVATGAGAVLGSAVDAVLQTTAIDAVEDEEPAE